MPAKDVDEYLNALKASPRFGPQVVHHEEFPAQSARFAEVKRPWLPEIEKALLRSGITELYSHQAEAVDRIREKKNVIVATPTASGKSLIYNLPVLEKVLTEPGSKALYLFPLKALAQDQLRVITEFISGFPEDLRPRAAICDGDTSAYHRKKLRQNPPAILISNPDMMHLSMLGYHENWSLFWQGLTHVVLDEVHTYRGVFGSHMAWVLRRLRRICRIHNADPRFVLSSATIANPEKFAHALLGLDVEVVTETGAPRGGRHFVFIDPHDSAGYAACQLLEAAIKRGLRTIVYTQSRKMTELVSVWTQSRLGPLKKKLTAYRAGFLPEERREIEMRLSSGDLYGVVSTSALELGIDIGELDICILVGYPGTIMATWQRGGRVGRRLKDSLIILVAQEDALDQHFMRNPADFFERGVEAAVLNPENRVIMERHLVCAAAELPIPVDDPLLSGSAGAVLSEMSEDGRVLLGHDGRAWFTNRKYPHREVDLRGSGKTFMIKTEGDLQLLGEIDAGRCQKECDPGAIYLHRGMTWLVTHLDPNGREVVVRRQNVNYFTRTQGQKETEILKIYATITRRNFRASFGFLRVTETVTGFQRRLVRGQRIISRQSLDLPPLVFETEGLWIEIPGPLQERLEQDMVHFMGGIHAVEHAAIGIFPLLVLCDRNDVGGIAHPAHPELPGAAVFIYDGHPGGVGLSRQAFERIEDLLAMTQKTVASCPCETGCPSCVHSPKCGSGNRPIDKAASLRVLEGLLSSTLKDIDTMPAVPVRVLEESSGGGSPVTEKFQGVEEENERGMTPLLPAGEKAARRNAAARDDVMDEGTDAEPVGSRYCVFDLETKRSAQEVGGWHRAERMGISVGVVYDSGQDEYLVFREDEIEELVISLQRFDLVIGFNNKRFDNRVLSAYTDIKLHALPTLDLLEEVKKRLGYRLSLDALAQYTLGVKKSADGLMALKWYKEGRIDKIIKYCRKDVEITRNLYLFGLQNKYLLFQNKAGTVVRCPVNFGGKRQK
ncbi:MAG: DEAD/DEAH box helicase [Desulfobulbaceae bacterium]|nr:DEAD/DEAH box helicase [Desulfobulbaceae bacterium]